MGKNHKRPRDEILKFLLSNKESAFTIRAVAKNVAVDYKTTYHIMKDLIDTNTIIAKRAGQTIVCSALY
ncbi:hypothetical protein HZB01_04840 [Candidatus Woesearchaeota archaeon]|nr:hypothetical protein [Candidatus Woesearchaeota archaeon]